MTIKSKPAKSTTPRRKGNRGRLADGSANPIDIHVGQRVRLRRTLLGLSQEALGERLGLTFQQVQKYERGSNRVSCSRLFDLAQMLDVPVSFFFDDMPGEAQAASPVAVAKGGQVMAAHAELDPTLKRETLELVRNYYSITDPSVRRQVYELARALGSQER